MFLFLKTSSTIIVLFSSTEPRCFKKIGMNVAFGRNMLRIISIYILLFSSNSRVRVLSRSVCLHKSLFAFRSRPHCYISFAIYGQISARHIPFAHVWWFSFAIWIFTIPKVLTPTLHGLNSLTISIVHRCLLELIWGIERILHTIKWDAACFILYQTISSWSWNCYFYSWNTSYFGSTLNLETLWGLMPSVF